MNELKFMNPTKDWKETICIDFDGVIAKYDGWKGPDFFGKPKEGARDFLEKAMSAGFKIVIFTLRPGEKVLDWFEKHKLPLPKLITNSKVPALVYVDDRGLKFDGNFDSLFHEINSYKPYWEAGRLASQVIEGE